MARSRPPQGSFDCRRRHSTRHRQYLDSAHVIAVKRDGDRSNAVRTGPVCNNGTVPGVDNLSQSAGLERIGYRGEAGAASGPSVHKLRRRGQAPACRIEVPITDKMVKKAAGEIVHCEERQRLARLHHRYRRPEVNFHTGQASADRVEIDGARSVPAASPSEKDMHLSRVLKGPRTGWTLWRAASNGGDNFGERDRHPTSKAASRIISLDRRIRRDKALRRVEIASGQRGGKAPDRRWRRPLCRGRCHRQERERGGGQANDARRAHHRVSLVNGAPAGFRSWLPRKPSTSRMAARPTGQATNLGGCRFLPMRQPMKAAMATRMSGNAA